MKLDNIFKRCPICDKRYSAKALLTHFKNSKDHTTQMIWELLPDTYGLSYPEIIYWMITKKRSGSCIICHKPTAFNVDTFKYSRFCDMPSCKETYRKSFKTRMKDKYGKEHLLDDLEIQKKMLANRNISGTFILSGEEFTYTGEYEKAFLELLAMLNWPAGDLLAPSPKYIHYNYNDQEHVFIPDFYIPSIDCNIEVKSSHTKFYSDPTIQEKNKIKKSLIDSATTYGLWLEDKDFTKFIHLLKEIRDKQEG